MAQSKSRISTKSAQPKDKLLPKLTSFFFRRPRLTAALWIVLLGFGILCYTTLLRREGFPNVTVPIAIINGTYASDNPAELDSQVAQPIAKAALKQSTVSTVTTQTAGNFYNVVVQYKDGTNAKAATAELKASVSRLPSIPAGVSVKYDVPYFGVTGGDTQKIDMAISFYDQKGKATTPELIANAGQAVKDLNDMHVSGVKSFAIKNPYSEVTTPDGLKLHVQQTFDRVSFSSNGHYTDANSVLITVQAAAGNDVIKLDANVQKALDKLSTNRLVNGYGTRISASYAPSIKDNISELQRVLLEGLVIVLIVGSLIIAIRASLITVLSMLTVIALTIGLLYLVGYTLNVITLFALILGLSLIVDDTTIMVEAIDAGRRQGKDRAEIVQKATRKVSRAMVAATTTAALSFSPFLFVGGVLGSFIRAIPITIIASLIISLLVALIFIPFFARFTLLTRKQLSDRKHNELAARIEGKIAAFISRPMLWARHSRKKLTSLGLLAIIVGFGFLMAGGFLASKVVFNIFPAAKDTNQLIVSLNYPSGTTIEQAQDVAGRADQLTAQVLGANLLQSSYYGLANAQTASAQLQIISYNKRAATAPQLVAKLQKVFDKQFIGAKAVVNQVDTGPPSAAFTVQIKAVNRQGALRAADEVVAFLNAKELTRSSGKIAHFTHVTPPNPLVFTGAKGQVNVAVTASFDGNDTTTLVNLAQDAVKKEFTDTKLKTYGLQASDLSFDIGQESQNQDSFKTLALAFPILLLIMYLVLVLEFRSFLQPLLIFMAIPFSVFGVMFGLYATNNPISFFAMLGFFALIGLSIKNTILLTDFANQARRAGANPVDAAVAALKERFRPLFATSLIAVLSLVPLAVSSPFWQGLAVVLIFGLLSSTILVLTVFPYYYLGAEFLRAKTGRAARRLFRRR
jgi:HAE1 family hydrophobic/amphiphilic exporter-1